MGFQGVNGERSAQLASAALLKAVEHFLARPSTAQLQAMREAATRARSASEATF